MRRKVDDQWVSQVRIGVHDAPKKFVRVVFDLKQIGEHRVESHQDRIVVAFGAAVQAVSAAPAAVREGTTIALNIVGPVACRAQEAGARLEIKTSAKPEFAIVDSGDPAKIIIEIANAKIAEKDTKTLDLAALNLDVVKVSAFPYAKGDARLVRVVAQLRRPVPFRATAENERLVVDFEKSAAPAAATPAPALASAATAAPGAPAGAATPAPAAHAAATPAAGSAGSTEAQPQPQYTGRRLSLDFKDADVNDILRLISEVSELNFVAGPEVKGTVSIKLADVPWDQALDLILKTNVPQLAQIRESENIMRITTADKIMDEEQRRRRLEEDKKKTIDAQEALEPLVTKSYSLSYAETMSAVASQLGKFLSARGKVEPDERTKTLIVRDVAKVMAEIDAVIATLDAPTPGVIVEARIVQMDTTAGMDLGVQWGANFVADQEHGNSTKYAFPNSVNIGGTQQPGGTGPSYLVNLPAATSAAGIGISFGHVANTMGLDLRLSAMETMGKSKTLSNPRVLVLHNKEAKIHVGLELPLPKTDATGNRTVEFKPIGITLIVTPKVTNDKRVVMKINVSNDKIGGVVDTTEGRMYSVDKKEANTEVIVRDGETTVIGGMYEEATSDNTSGVPGFSKIPILGYLFKNTSKTLRRTELMIFLTPRIVVM
jgi:type IV pilus assembly protein PilQ